MKVAVTDRNTTRWGITLIIVGVIAAVGLVFSLSVNSIPVSASPVFATPLCGDGSAPDYGFTYNLQQEHWTVDWQDYVSEQTVTEVDAIFDRLNDDSIAQTMILFKSQAQVGNRTNCAVHFLRYMKLGLPYGEHKDNGFVFLIVVEPSRLDVHYGVGLGLPALTAPELAPLNRTAEDTYQSTHSIDQALLALVKEFDTVARGNYEPLVSPSATPETIDLPSLPSGPLGIFTLCCLLCVGTLIVLFVIWLFIQLVRRGIFIDFSGPSSGGGGWGRPFGGGGSSPPFRGGSGSGRSNRGN